MMVVITHYYQLKCTSPVFSNQRLFWTTVGMNDETLLDIMLHCIYIHQMLYCGFSQ